MESRFTWFTGSNRLLSAAVQGAGIGIFYFGQHPALMALGLGVFMAGAARDLPAALWWVLWLSPFYRFPKQLAGPEFVVSEVLILAAAVTWAGQQAWALAARRLTAGEVLRELRVTPFPVGPVVFLAVATVSLAWAEYPHVALREYRRVIVEPLIFYFLAARTVRPKELPGWVFGGFTVAGAVVGFYALYHYYVVGITEATGGVRRALAIYHSPNALALYLGKLIPPAVLLAAGWGGRGRLAAGITAIGGLWALWLTYSRGAWLGLAAALAAGFGLLSRHRRLTAALILAGALAVIGLLGLLLAPGRFGADETALRRIYIWEAALRMIRDRPLTGVGLDNFLYVYRERYMPPEAWQEPDISHPHNIVLDFWVRLGIGGVFALGLLQVEFWRRVFNLARSAGPDPRLIAALCGAAMADLLVHGLFDNSYFLIDLAYLFWFMFVSVRLAGVSQ
jgi:O-antigen ligase